MAAYGHKELWDRSYLRKRRSETIIANAGLRLVTPKRTIGFPLRIHRKGTPDTTASALAPVSAPRAP
ncbi:hypothetical protein GCM10010182_67090 [Actinomadura cremea]|nr:hypothetical protein GCM10010182_67090 [Actinomadura cremea]